MQSSILKDNIDSELFTFTSKTDAFHLQNRVHENSNIDVLQNITFLQSKIKAKDISKYIYIYIYISILKSILEIKKDLTRY